MSAAYTDAARVLDRAADIIVGGHWAQGWSALDADGNGLERGDLPQAVCWCVGAAIDKAAHELFGENALVGGPIGCLADALFVKLDRAAALTISDDQACDQLTAINDNPHADERMILDRLSTAARIARAS